jgi:heme/copper-type cytochrome/quinol oxidase subunit 2
MDDKKIDSTLVSNNLYTIINYLYSMLIYILVGYIAVTTIAIYKIEYEYHKRLYVEDDDDLENSIFFRTLYMTTPVCYYITLFYFTWYIVASLSMPTATLQPPQMQS